MMLSGSQAQALVKISESRITSLPGHDTFLNHCTWLPESRICQHLNSRMAGAQTSGQGPVAGGRAGARGGSRELEGCLLLLSQETRPWADARPSASQICSFPHPQAQHPHPLASPSRTLQTAPPDGRGCCLLPAHFPFPALSLGQVLQENWLKETFSMLLTPLPGSCPCLHSLQSLLQLVTQTQKEGDTGPTGCCALTI